MAHDSVATSATLFEDVGKQVEGMKTTQSDALEGSSAVAGVSLSKEPSEPMPVDEIESLCMNCGKDVRCIQAPQYATPTLTLKINRASLDSS